MGNQRVIGPPLAFSRKIQERFGHLEEHLDIPSVFVGRYDLLFSQGGIGGQQGQPLFAASVPNEYDLCRYGAPLVILADPDQNRGENLCTAPSLANLSIDGRQMEIFPLVTMEDLFRDLGMHPLGKQFPHDYGVGKPAVEQKMTGVNTACHSLGHHLDKKISCLGDAFPVMPRSIGATVRS